MALIARTLGLVLVVAAVGAAAQPAFGADTYTCYFEGGLAGALVPPIPAIVHDPGGIYTFERGTYHLVASPSCVKVDTDSGQTNVLGLVGMMYSDGVYASASCGVEDQWDAGHLPGQSIFDTHTAGEWQDPDGSLAFAYHIDFTGRQGTMTILDAQHQEWDGSVRSGGSGFGYVNVMPTGGGDCIEGDVDFWSVNGAFTLSV